MTDVERCTYRVRWSQEDEQFLGTVAQFPSLSWAADSSPEAFSGIRSVVVDVLADMAGAGAGEGSRLVGPGGG
ncbi:hypothetical protein HRK28_06710 [Rathayibacter sp. VKM Ac-2835]|uniref:hypothetical protein n=1 Tax=Rathayibacter sp. VKM Ac-2835 TaxID=2739043 RepID=UPI0015639CD3|nr:hypothetical protein [Rathayibacter sp. VKM Ac-2835]NRG40610.1 hypothetical protein [Rathayibacter sp. VKM Ac-2835]